MKIGNVVIWVNCPAPYTHIFERLIPSWCHWLGRLRERGTAGGSISLDVDFESLVTHYIFSLLSFLCCGLEKMRDHSMLLYTCCLLPCCLCKYNSNRLESWTLQTLSYIRCLGYEVLLTATETITCSRYNLIQTMPFI